MERAVACSGRAFESRSEMACSLEEASFSAAVSILDSGQMTRQSMQDLTLEGLRSLELAMMLEEALRLEMEDCMAVT
ncbi:Uncharacterised protein [uncultured archaeon]|nr:Uncharacterised protein [uncultured archaeon]